MNDSDRVLIRISKILEIGSLRKKLQPFKDHRKTEKSGGVMKKINGKLPKMSKSPKIQNQLFFLMFFFLSGQQELSKTLQNMCSYRKIVCRKIFLFDWNFDFGAYLRYQIPGHCFKIVRL